MSTIAEVLRAAGYPIMAELLIADARAVAPALREFDGDCAVVVGNTRDLWPRFVAEFRNDAQLRESPDPFNTFVEIDLQKIVGHRNIRFAHRRYNEAYVPMQRLAVAAGIGTLSSTHLVIHREFGPWFSIRAVIEANRGEGETLDMKTTGCESSCATRCHVAFELANQQGKSGSWQHWLAVRSACTRGAPWRFSDEQIIYHYAHDRRVIGTGMSIADFAVLDKAS
jgi:hypothetical protein